MSKAFFSLVKYQLANVVRAKWILAYGLFFFFFTNALLMFGGDSSKAVASILTMTLLIVPMIIILYASIYWYNSESFTSLLLTQPLRRSSIFLSICFSVSIGLAGSFESDRRPPGDFLCHRQRRRTISIGRKNQGRPQRQCFRLALFSLRAVCFFHPPVFHVAFPAERGVG